MCNFCVNQFLQSRENFECPLFDVTNMEIMENDGSGENTDELLSADVDEGVDVYGLIPLALSHDHCDVLLDAIDDQLSHLQIYSHSQMHGGNSKKSEFAFLDYLDRSQSVSKDTGLGSTVPTNEKTPSIPEWTQTAGKDDRTEQQTIENSPEGDSSSLSRAEQCRWRLERLLGRNVEMAGIGNEEDDFTHDSVNTEDFSTRFREEILLLPASDGPPTRSDMSNLIEDQLKTPQCPSKTPVRHLAGVPMQSFDTVTIDTDLDTVCSEQVRQHLKSVLSNRKANAFCLRKENGFCTGQTIQNKIQSSSADDESSIDEMSSEGAAESKLHWRRRHSSGRKGKRSSLHQSRRKDSHITAERAQDKSRTDGDQVKELRVSLAELQQQKTATLHTLEKLREEVRDSGSQAQNIKCELRRLQAQRDLCLEEVRVLQEQQRCVSSSVSVLEREEMDRLLENAKSELFSEQRRFRHTLDSMQERLDEVNQELDQREDDCRSLQKKCSELEEQLAETTRDKEQIKQSSQKDLEKQVKRFRALERTVAQKELLLQGTEEAKEALLLELCSLKEAHRLKLREMQNGAEKHMEQEIEKLTSRLTKNHKDELQKVCQHADELRSADLREQAQIHNQRLDSLHNCIQMKDEEIQRLKVTLEQHEEKMRRQEAELRRETQEKIQKTLKQEERKWEELKETALKEQRGTLEQQKEDAVKRWREEVEKERRNALALQSKVNELQKEAEREAMRLKQTLLRSEKELQELRMTLTEKQQKHQRRTARYEQQSRRWAQDIQAECVCLQELIKHNGLTDEHTCPSHSDSSTVSETLQTLQTLTKALQQHVNDLKNELNSQRRATLMLRQEKEQELRLQKEQLTEEKETAIAALKEKLIQEHIEEMSSLSRVQQRMKDDNTDGSCVRLHRQLKAKDEELRQVQNNMAEWKDKTTARLAHRFELELNTELERRVPKSRAEHQKRLERLENEMRHLTEQYRECSDSQLVSSSLQGGTDFQNIPVTQELTSYKVLRHLQSRIRQLQAENQSHGPVNRHREPTNLGGSYLDTIAPAHESCKTEDHFSAKIISS